jgi:hypothetical protein
MAFLFLEMFKYFVNLNCVIGVTLLSFALPKESSKEKATTKKPFLPASFRVHAHARKGRAFRGRQPHWLLPENLV